MPYVWGILSFLFWILGFVMFLGLINPKWINKKLKENQKPFTRKKALVAWFAFSFLFIVFAAIAVPKTTNSASEPLANAPKSTVQATITPKATETPKASAMPTATELPKPTQSNASSTTPTPSNKPIETTAPSPKIDSDKSFLEALDTITYNTFVEASNIGDQLTGYSKNKYSRDDLDNFFQDDAALWRMYIDTIKKVDPSDVFLIEVKKGVLTYLTDLQAKALVMSEHFKKNELGNLSNDGGAMVLDLNKLKDQYSMGVSQMKKYGIKPNWQP